MARPAGCRRDPATALTRLDQLEAELRRLTDRVDVLTNDVRRIVDDATNRVGDIEFRLTELEGGDTSIVAKPEPLGGGVTGPRPRPAPARGGARDRRDAAGGDRADRLRRGGGGGRRRRQRQGGGAVRRASSPTIRAGRCRPRRSSGAARRWRRPRDWRGAARSYLDAFSGAPQGPLAPRALYRLAIALGELGQVEEACLTLTEVDTRYPGSEVAGEVASQRATLRCP